MNKRTVRDFKAGVDFWSMVDNWAKETGYALKESSSTKRLYQKGGVILWPMMLELSQTGTDVHLEAWVRLYIFRIWPLDVGIESGGFTGFVWNGDFVGSLTGGVFASLVGRNISRTAVNKLLTRINQPLIQ